MRMHALCVSSSEFIRASQKLKDENVMLFTSLTSTVKMEEGNKSVYSYLYGALGRSLLQLP